jgi:valyl-tRNA synthetase
MAPLEMIQRHSADAVRYWAAGAGPGKDAVISEEKVRMGAKLVTKVWNVARFCAGFLEGYRPPPDLHPGDARLTPADAWILARLQGVIGRTTRWFEDYDYAAARNEVESFFWRDLADNYLEMCKLRLYDTQHPQREGARFALHTVLPAVLKLFAPLLPFVTEAVYRQLYAGDGPASIHVSAWPEVAAGFDDPQAEALGETLVQIGGSVRRYKSEHSLSLGAEIRRLQIGLVRSQEAENGDTLRLFAKLPAAIPDLQGITRAREIEIVELPAGRTGGAGQMPADRSHFTLSIEE